MNKTILFKTFRNTISATAYIYFISQVLNNGGSVFGSTSVFSEIAAPFIFLLIFVISAAVVGGLVFGETIIQFVNKKVANGVRAAVYSVGWLFIYALVGILLLSILK